MLETVLGFMPYLEIFNSGPQVSNAEYRSMEAIVWVRRVVGTIWNVGAGDQVRVPYGMLTRGIPLRLTNRILTR